MASFSTSKFPIVAPDTMMNARQHGTCINTPQSDLRFNVDYNTADRICCFNRHYAEHSHYAFNSKITWIQEI